MVDSQSNMISLIGSRHEKGADFLGGGVVQSGLTSYFPTFVAYLVSIYLIYLITAKTYYYYFFFFWGGVKIIAKICSRDPIVSQV